ncbi:unnamed protein product [Pedinophyceae sp. YPF-701]|nr:unnamed protein product [Pedinophyceae sp. YPF-701]
MALSLARGRRVSLAKVDAFADGVAVKLVGAETFRLCRELLDGIVLVSNSQISAAIKDVFNETRSILEPAGAVSVAGAKAYYDAHPTERGTTAVCVTSGANMNFDRLRLVSELADVGARSEAMLVTTIPESPGSFSDFVEVGYYGAAPQDAAEVTEFKYRYDECAGQGKAHILHSVAVKSRDELKRMIARLNGAGYQTRDLSAMEDAQVHLRHLVGGRAGAVRNERLFVVEFPERPGALKIFLRPFSPRWNVTAFHYRRSGNQVSSVLVGLQVPVEDEGEFKDAVAGLDSGFAFRELSAEAYEAFKYFLS